MGLNTAGLTVLLDQGANATLWLAIGDGDTAVDQISDQRRLITWNAAADAELDAADLPYQFTGPADGDASHMLFFSASTAGTFYGFAALDGDTVFNSAGEFEVVALTLAGQATADEPSAPEAPFVSGEEVGVPEGTVLTNRTTLGANTGTGTYVLVHPVSGETVERDVLIWENIRFTQAISNVGPADPETQAYLFRNCSWEVPETSWCVEINQGVGVNDQMAPVAIFDHCSFDGQGNSNIGAAVNFGWMQSCDVIGMLAASPAVGASDGVQGLAYTVIIDSNLIAGTNEDLPDPHSDGVQNTGTGHITLFHNWISAGASAGANAAIRVGTEDGAVADVEVYYNTVDDGGYAVQFRGDAGAGDITGVVFVGNRWTRTAVEGPTDFEQTTVTTWEDNAYLDNGEIIPNPAP